MNEIKEYEVGTVEITTTEYRDIITEAVENRKNAEYERDKRWKAETELKAAKEELVEVQKKVVVLEARLADLAWAEHQSAKCEEAANNG